MFVRAIFIALVAASSAAMCQALVTFSEDQDEGDPFFQVIDECIVGFLSGPETTAACADSGLNCCIGDPSNGDLRREACQWNRQPVKICKDACRGDRACENVVNPSIGFGSCVGLVACRNGQATIGDFSCVSFEQACERTKAGSSIGNNSCNSAKGCEGLTGSVGNGSCNGGEQDNNNCLGANSIGDNSCNSIGDGTKRFVEICERAGIVGDNSCNAEDEDDVELCDGATFVGDNVQSCDEGATCNGFKVEDDCIIGELTGEEMTAICAEQGLNCCVGENACVWEQQPAKICKDACQGEQACENLVNPSVGIGSCGTSAACQNGQASVGDFSCLLLQSCKDTKAGSSIGNNSCDTENACRLLTGRIGNGSCNGGIPAFGICTGANSIGDNSCNNFDSPDLKRFLESCRDVGIVGDNSCNTVGVEDSGVCREAAFVGDCVDFCDEGETCEGVCVNGGAVDDPHFKTWSGTWFDFMGACDLHLVTAPHFAKKPTPTSLLINIRTKIRYAYSYIESAVLQIADDVLEVTSFGEYYLNYVSHADLTDANATIGGFHIMHQQLNDHTHKFEVHIGPAETIVFKTFKDMVSVMVHNATRDRFHGSLGMMGEFGSGRMLARDGVTLMEDVNEFAAEWQVRDTEPMLFMAVNGIQHPHQCVMPSSTTSVTPERRRLGQSLVEQAAAEEACATWPEDMRKNCVADVIATGDLELAAAGAF